MDAGRAAHYCAARVTAKAQRIKFTVTLDRDEDGVWIAECPAIPGCVSQGRTREEALGNVKEAIAACLEVRAESGMPLTDEPRRAARVSLGG